MLCRMPSLESQQYYKRNLSPTSRNRVKTLAILSYRIFLSHSLLTTLRSLACSYEFVCLLGVLVAAPIIACHIAAS